MSKNEKLTEFEKKWGKVCPKCKLRKGTFIASRELEGGRDSTCKCDDK